MKASRQIAWVTLIIVLFTSCSSQKKAYKAPLKEKGENYLISKMQDNESHFDTFKAKALVQLSNNGKVSDLKVNFRIKKDSAIWVSISVGMGLEAARILLTHDSVLFINRLEKTFFVGNYKFINQLINAQVDFDIVQALITGNDFNWYDYHDLHAKVSTDHYQLESDKRRKLKKFIKKNDTIDHAIYQCMWLNPETYKIEKIKIKQIQSESKKITAEYGDFKTIDGEVFPTQYNITITANNDVLIDGTLIKSTINKPISFPFNIPSKYKEIKM